MARKKESPPAVGVPPAPETEIINEGTPREDSGIFSLDEKQMEIPQESEVPETPDMASGQEGEPELPEAQQLTETNEQYEQRIRDAQEKMHKATQEASAAKKLMSQILINQMQSRPQSQAYTPTPQVDEYGNPVQPDTVQALRQVLAERDAVEDEKEVNRFITATEDFADILPEMQVLGNQLGFVPQNSIGLKQLYKFAKDRKIIEEHKAKIQSSSQKANQNIANYSGKPTFVQPTAPTRQPTSPDFDGVNPATGVEYTADEVKAWIAQNMPNLISNK